MATRRLRDATGLPYTALSYATGPGNTGRSNLQYPGPKHFPHEPANYTPVRGRPDLSAFDTTAPDYLQESLVPLRSGAHSGEDVAIYANGPGAELFRGVRRAELHLSRDRRCTRLDGRRGEEVGAVVGRGEAVFRSAFTLWLFAISASGGCSTADQTRGEWLPCSFLPVEDEVRDVVPHCARRGADGALRVEPIALAVLATRGVDPATVSFGGTLHYLNAAGVAVPVLPFDNGADYFVEGLARTVQDGKIGFIDEDLRVVIPPRWTFAFPFEKGAAVVCDGCTFHPVGDGHREVVGGRWGIIDTEGHVVVPVVHSREALRALREQ